MAGNMIATKRVSWSRRWDLCKGERAVRLGRGFLPSKVLEVLWVSSPLFPWSVQVWTCLIAGAVGHKAHGMGCGTPARLCAAAKQLAGSAEVGKETQFLGRIFEDSWNVQTFECAVALSLTFYHFCQYYEVLSKAVRLKDVSFFSDHF